MAQSAPEREAGACRMIRPDEIPPQFGIILVVVLLILWFVVEVHFAKDDPNPEPTNLDVLEKTGHYPGGRA